MSPNPLQAAGGAPDKEPRYVPIHTNRWWTGLWTNRSPLRDAATPYLYEKFYAGSRFESILAGQNIELTPRLTPARRPGLSVYNNQSFPVINDFYAFHLFDYQNVESIKVILDTMPAVYDATGPSTHTVLFNKTSGASQTSFQSVGNTLYMGDGVDLKKWVWTPSWTINTSYQLETVVTDSNGNLQVATAEGEISVEAVTVASNVLTVGMTGNFSAFQLQTLPGQLITFHNVGTATFLNGITVVISTAFNFMSQAIITANYVHANYGPTADTGTGYGNFGLGGFSGGSAPSWSTTPGGLTFDNTLQWTCKGSGVETWGIVAPTVAPNVANTLSTDIGSSWAASTYYWPSLTIIDSNNNIQMLTTSGTTSTVPVWNMSGTTTDGTAVWTFQGSANRATSHAYVIGNMISVTYTVTKLVKRRDPETGMTYYDEITLGPYTSTFISTVAGTSSSTATGLVAWPNGVGATITDGTVVWKNAGSSLTRTAAASSHINISNSTIVSTITQIVDSNGFFENILTGGLSGGSAPTWSSTLGGITTDNQAFWTNAGSATAANTLPWLYAYAYKNSVTGQVSTASPASSPIILAATSYISVSGNGSSDSQVDTIEIYRTTLGQSTLFFLADIPAPLAGGAWSYADTSPDPPTPGSTLNEFIAADVTGFNSPPPAGLTALTYHLNRVWGVSGEFVYYSAAPNESIGVGAESFPPVNYFQMPSSVTLLWPSVLGLMIFAVDGIYLSQGEDVNGAPLTPVLFTAGVGLMSRNAFTVNGSTPLFFTSDRQLLSMDPSSGLSRVGFPIEDQLQNFDPSSAYVTWHTHGPDQGLFIADGSTGWYRLNLTPAPENSGFTWSPKANIVGGCHCVKSIETSPGNNTLLVGPTSPGVVLMRDFSTNADNGSTYPATFTVGSIVLAQPGQAAEIAFITTEALMIGSIPSISVLIDEISGTFDLLTVWVNDPPYLVDSSTLFASRWYFNELQEPSWMRHLQLTFSWPAENKANELLTYTLSGALHTE